MEQLLLNLLMFLIPALITGAIAYLFFREFVNNENNRRRFLINKDLQKESLPIRLQAYERIALFLERISPNNLLVRIQPTNDDKNDYETLLVATIEQEFEHNLTQQIYMSVDCWTVVVSAKNATIQWIRKINMNDSIDSADKLRQDILSNLFDKQVPSQTALAYIKKEVQALW